MLFGVVFIVLASLAGFFAWNHLLSPQASLRFAYARVVGTHGKEIAEAFQQAGGMSTLSDSTLSELTVLAKRFQQVEGAASLRQLAECYLSNPHVGKGNDSEQPGGNDILASKLASVLVPALNSNQLGPARELALSLGDYPPFSFPDDLQMLCRTAGEKGGMDFRESYDEAFQLERAGQFAKAADRYQDAVVIAERNDLTFPAAKAIVGRALSLQKLGRNAEANSACEKAKAWLAKSRAEHVVPDYMGEVYYQLANALSSLSRPLDAFECLKSGLELHRPRLQKDAAAILLDLNQLTLNGRRAGKLAEAIRYGEEAVQMCGSALAGNTLCETVRLNLAAALRQQSRFREAEQLYQAAIRNLEGKQSDKDGIYVLALSNYADMLEKTGRGEAEKTRKKAEEAKAAMAHQPGVPSGQLTSDAESLGITALPETPKDVAAPPGGAKRTTSGLSYRVITPGKGKVHPTTTSKVTVHYTGWSKDGKMFDSSVQRGVPSSFSLNEVILGWTEGLQLMVEGEKTRFWIPGNLAYGEVAKRPGAPTGQLTFDIELLQIAH
jgi:peptidylprolyl isomerase